MSTVITFNSQNIIFNKKSIKHVNKQESMAHSQKKWTETIPEEVQTLNLLDKDFESAFKNILKELKKIIDKELKETRRTIYKQTVSIKSEKI